MNKNFSFHCVCQIFLNETIWQQQEIPNGSLITTSKKFIQFLRLWLILVLFIGKQIENLIEFEYDLEVVVIFFHILNHYYTSHWFRTFGCANYIHFDSIFIVFYVHLTSSLNCLLFFLCAYFRRGQKIEIIKHPFIPSHTLLHILFVIFSSFDMFNHSLDLSSAHSFLHSSNLINKGYNCY